MKSRDKILDTWLQTASLPELRASINAAAVKLSLPEAQRLTSHIRGLNAAAHRLRLGIVHTYTSNLLDPWLAFEAALQGIGLETYHAPYGLTLQEAEAGSGLARHDPELTLLLLQWEDLHPALGKPLAAMDASAQAALRDDVVGRLYDMVARFREHIQGHIVVTLLPSLYPPGLGLYDAQSERSESGWRASVRAAVAARLREGLAACLFIDLDVLLAQLGREGFFDLRYWYSARYPFSPVAARELARQLMALGAVIKYPKAKVIALDADNTLWGGIIGEDGINGIALGPDYPGNTYLAFQRRLLDFQQRGLVLALCSKNNPQDVDEVLRDHPHQLLRHEHFAARRVGWDPKPQSLIALARELNLGLDSFIFVDDSAHECAAIRHELPQVEVVQIPGKAIDIPTCLDRVARLEVLSVTVEDLSKTRLYSEERQRRELEASLEGSAGGLADYLRSLQMKMRIGFDDSSHLARLTQLTQKTNQFNLTTRRYDEAQMRAFISSPEWLVAHFSLSDIFGDSGVVGLALVRRLGDRQAELDTFLMSCRVIGRRAESAFLDALLRRLAREGVTEVVGDYLPTPKNSLVERFLPEHGFEAGEDGRFRRDLGSAPAADQPAHPIIVKLSG